MSEPLVSVLLPAYKHEEYVQETIKSIIAQSYKNIELLVIDDGSPDGTWEVIKALHLECEKRFTRVVIHRQQNKGLCNTYNKLLSEAVGKYIFIINSDDVARSEAVDVLVEFLEYNNDYAVAVGNSNIIDEYGVQIYWNRAREVSYNASKNFYGTFKDYFYNVPGHHSVNYDSSEFGAYDTLIKKGNHIPNGYLIRKSIFDVVGGYTDAGPVEDYYIFLQISKYAKIKYIDMHLMSYRWHSANTIRLRDESYRFTDRTLTYEKKIVDACTDDGIKRSFYEKFNRKRYIVKFGKIFSIYKIKNMIHKKFFVQIFDKNFEVFHFDRSIKD